MAIGFPNKSTRPVGRKVFAEKPNVVRHEVIPEGKYADGQTRDGTPNSNVHTTFGDGKRDYAAGAGHRAREGSQPYPGMGGKAGRDNPRVHSKDDKFHGQPHTPGKVARPGEEAGISGGNTAGKLYVDPIGPSIAQRNGERAVDHHEFIPPLGSANHPNTGKHFAGHASGRHADTDSAPGQSHSASGGTYGRPQVRPPSSGGRRAGVASHDGRGKLDRSEYTGGKK